MDKTIAVTTVMKMRLTVLSVIPQETGSVPTNAVSPNVGCVTLIATVRIRAMRTPNSVVKDIIPVMYKT
jgi:hypothetical protein